MLKPVSILLFVSLAIWPSLASARGGGHFGGGHFGGGMGLHGGYERGLEGGVGRSLRLPGNRRQNRPAMEASIFAAVEITAAPDPDTLPGLTTKLTASLPDFNGHIVVNDASPGVVDGVTPASFILVAFATPQDMARWKTSEPFKAFEADAQKVSARIFTVTAVASTPVAERVDPVRDRESKAYQKLIEGNDRTLKKIQDICSHC